MTLLRNHGAIDFLMSPWVVMVSMFGFFTSFVILETIVLVEILGLENLTSAFGLILLFQGLASMIGTPIAG